MPMRSLGIRVSIMALLSRLNLSRVLYSRKHETPDTLIICPACNALPVPQAERT